MYGSEFLVARKVSHQGVHALETFEKIGDVFLGRLIELYEYLDSRGRETWYTPGR